MANYTNKKQPGIGNKKWKNSVVVTIIHSKIWREQIPLRGYGIFIQGRPKNNLIIIIIIMMQT